MGDYSEQEPNPDVVVQGYTTTELLSYPDEDLRRPNGETNIVHREGGAALTTRILKSFLSGHGKVKQNVNTSSSSKKMFHFVVDPKKWVEKDEDPHKNLRMYQQFNILNDSSGIWPLKPPPKALSRSEALNLLEPHDLKDSVVDQKNDKEEHLLKKPRVHQQFDILDKLLGIWPPKPPKGTLFRTKALVLLEPHDFKDYEAIKRGDFEWLIYYLSLSKGNQDSNNKQKESIDDYDSPGRGGVSYAANSVVIVDVEDLRSGGLGVSRNLSWERTMEDLVLNLKTHDTYKHLLDYPNIIVSFGVDGALRISKSEADPALYFHPLFNEGIFIRSCKTKMTGLKFAFVAGLAGGIVAPTEGFTEKDDKKEDIIGRSIKQGIAAARHLAKEGFQYINKTPDYPDFSNFKGSAHTAITKFSTHITDDECRNSSWSILGKYAEQNLRSAVGNQNAILDLEVVEKMIYDLQDVGAAFVVAGWEKLDKDSTIPIAEFGKDFVTADRYEIESYRAIENLVSEYLRSKQTKPLSIAVFGQPGSGKSFGVKKVIQQASVDSNEKFGDPIEVNLSQLTSPSDLIAAFHRVRDITLGAKIPIIIFDEFDSHLEQGGGKLGWLRYFLAPMQDGEFLDDGIPHPLGRAIFVFIGGTSRTLAEFMGKEDEDGTVRRMNSIKGSSKHQKDKEDEETLEKQRLSIKKEAKAKADLQRGVFEGAKGPDFASRLRGYVNIQGLSYEGVGSAMQLMSTMVRRAILLRTLINLREGSLSNNKNHIEIDVGILDALVQIPKYEHGTRSMEQILSMSSLSGKQRFTYNELPSEAQLNLHVNGKKFIELCRKSNNPTRQENFNAYVAED